MVRQGYPWLLGAAAILWLGNLVERRRSATRQEWRGLPPSWERPLQLLVEAGCPLLGLALLGVAARLRESTQRQAWLTLAGLLLALAAALVLTVGLAAGTVQNLRTQASLTLPEFRQTARLQLVLSLPVNGALTLLGWATAARGLRALTTPGGPATLPRVVRWRACALTAAVAVVAGLALWRLTVLPVSGTSPADGAIGIPTNAPIVVWLRGGGHNWLPGITATDAETGQYVRGSGGGTGDGGAWFMPEGGWRPNARIHVRICCGPFTRSYDLTFTTANGPSLEVTPLPGPTPKPTAVITAP